MMKDQRESWEIAASICVQLTHAYAQYLELDPMRKRIYGNAFGAGENFDEWTREKTREMLAHADALVQEHGPVTSAPDAVVRYAEYLRAKGWNGTALDAGGFRTEVDVYD